MQRWTSLHRRWKDIQSGRKLVNGLQQDAVSMRRRGSAGMQRSFLSTSHMWSWKDSWRLWRVWLSARMRWWVNTHESCKILTYAYTSLTSNGVVRCIVIVLKTWLNGLLRSKRNKIERQLQTSSVMIQHNAASKCLFVFSYMISMHI